MADWKPLRASDYIGPYITLDSTVIDLRTDWNGNVLATTELGKVWRVFADGRCEAVNLDMSRLLEKLPDA